MRSFGENLRKATRASGFRHSAVLRSGLYLVFAAPLLASCIASNQTGPYRPVSIAEDVESIKRIAYPVDLAGFYSMSPSNQANGRHQIVSARVYIHALANYFFDTQRSDQPSACGHRHRGDWARQGLQ